LGFWGRSERTVIEALSLERVAGCYALGTETVRPSKCKRLSEPLA